MQPLPLLKKSAHEIDWLNAKSQITPSFTVYEACWLPSVNSLYYPLVQERENLFRLCGVLERIRSLLGEPLIVHCMVRPEWYNAMIKGSEKSAHIVGLACDFHVRGMSCDAVREVLRKNAEILGICIEDVPGGAWVHVDLGEPRPNGGRFFKP